MTLDAAAIQRLVSQLPATRRWFVQETPLDYDFSAGRRTVTTLRPESFDFPMKPEWLQLLVFGEYDYAEGGGAHPFLGVRPADGFVCGLDVELDKPLFVLNSSLHAFIATFEAIDAYLANSQALPRGFSKTLKAIDPAVFGKSNWKPFVTFATAEE